MRKTLVCAAAAAYLGMAGSAVAGGMYEGEGSMKDAPVEPIVQMPNWTGLYVGAGFGGGAMTHAVDAEVLGGLLFTFGQDYGAEGFFGTVQAGFDYHFANRWVAGVFADYDWMDMDARVVEASLLTTPIIDAEIESAGMWTVGGRLGYLFTPHTLVYGLVGYSNLEYDGLNGSILAGAIPFNIDLQDVDAVTVGGGIETLLFEDLALKLEYRYSDFDDEQIDALTVPGFLQTDLDTDAHTARAVLTYKFNMGY